ncbi:MAG: type II/IV secretion system ATPase subunit, partial [Candidatus Aenigmatarchaeota archaeon]
MILKYELEFENTSLKVTVSDEEGFLPTYTIDFPTLDEGTAAVFREIKNRLISEVEIGPINEGPNLNVKRDFREKAGREISRLLPRIPERTKEYLISLLIQEMLGLGKLELILNDSQLEEIVINSANECVRVYHKRFGWANTNIKIEKEEEVLNYASIIARTIGKQINVLNPLLDAHLPSGDRVNATLYPISNEGNTMTIRKFRRDPWTITDFIENHTISLEAAAYLWFAIQYELNILVSGGTGTGKTSILTTLLSFIPPNQRVLSIEDTREIKLPDFLHWIPMVTRTPNQEGKGEVTMLDLLINSLRMRPDRIILGEVRRSREAEVLFEAMHTGHSISSTIHADTALQTYRRLTSPPISVPESLVEAVDLFIVMFRDRRKGIRRVYEIAEVMPQFGNIARTEKINLLYKWDSGSDTLAQFHESKKALLKLEVLLGLTRSEINKELGNRQKVLQYMLKKNIRNVNEVGRVISTYVKNPDDLLKRI